VLPGFTARYNINRLVYFEVFGDIAAAIAREKQIKSWRRGKRIDLIESVNRDWEDLSAGWYGGQGAQGGRPKKQPERDPRCVRNDIGVQRMAGKDELANLRTPGEKEPSQVGALQPQRGRQLRLGNVENSRAGLKVRPFRSGSQQFFSRL